jgi:hypothetical protein
MREDGVYRQLFGTVGPHVHTIPPQLFSQIGFNREPDPRWLVHGVFEIAPTEKLPWWTYVTTALSNPWGQDPATINPEEPSGLGFELLMHTPAQAAWAIQVLHWLMAINILAGSGLLQGETVFAGARVPLHTSIDPRVPDSPVRNLLIADASHLVAGFKLPSGTVDLLLCLGITDAEMKLAATQNYDETIDLLKSGGIFPVTDPART